MRRRRWVLDAGDGGGNGGAGDGGAGDGGGAGNGNEGGSEDWRAGLPDEVRNSPSIASFTTLEGLIKSFTDTKADHTRLTQELAQRPANNAIVVPPDDATEEAMAAYRKAVGIPEKNDAYEFPASRAGDPTRPQEGSLTIDESLRPDLMKAAHAVGMTQKQFDVMTALFLETHEQAIRVSQEQIQADHDQSQLDLQQRFGSELPQLEADLGRIESAFGEEIEGKPWYKDLLGKKVFPNGLGNDGGFRTLQMRILKAMRLERVMPPTSGNPSNRDRGQRQRLPAGRRSFEYDDMEQRADGLHIRPARGATIGAR